jgi:predicted nucleic acid-binding protein
LKWLPVTEAIVDRVESIFASAPASTNLRAADALHLACAAEHGFTEVHSNDRLFLAAAPIFGLKGVNVIPPL